jgi:hypothetical protein
MRRSTKFAALALMLVASASSAETWIELNGLWLRFLKPPTSVSTEPAGSISGTSAVLNGAANPNSNSTTAKFRWGTSNVACSSLVQFSSTSQLGEGDTTTTYQATLSGLSVNTTYYYCASAENPDGLTLASVESFTTLHPVPTVSTGSASQGLNCASPPCFSSVTFSGTVNPNGSSTTAIFRYGTSNVACDQLPSTAGYTSVGSGNTQQSVTAVIASSPNTTYFYCVQAWSGAGTSNGSVESFTTDCTFPVAHTTCSPGCYLGQCAGSWVCTTEARCSVPSTSLDQCTDIFTPGPC